MIATLDSFTADGRVVLSFPESALQAVAREDFIAFTKREWLARQSHLTETEATSIAHDIDSGWWDRNRKRILKSIGER